VTGTPRRLVVYARVSTAEQTCQNQLDEMRQYVTLRGWVIAQEFIDEGVSGAKESPPAFDALMKDAKRRRFDALLVLSLDRVGRSLRHLVIVLDDLQHAGVTLISQFEQTRDWLADNVGPVQRQSFASAAPVNHVYSGLPGAHAALWQISQGRLAYLRDLANNLCR
jgi:DNA invertase Pin-like site-specific DNA recombinase